MSPLDLPALGLLEIKDNIKNNARHYWSLDGNVNGWTHTGRKYIGLIPFLGSITTGALPVLTTLWTDERVLLPISMSVCDFLRDPDAEASDVLHPFHQLTSLRVGFGRIADADAGTILDLCDPAKLTQFGFEWNWQAFGEDEVCHFCFLRSCIFTLRYQLLSPALLKHLSRFPLLADIHILFPRPETERSLDDLTTDPHTIADVAALFSCNPHIQCVGIGNSVVWERGHNSSTPILVCDGVRPPDPSVSRFFHAGYMLNAVEPEGRRVGADNIAPSRLELGEEIEQLRDVLKHIVAT